MTGPSHRRGQGRSRRNTAGARRAAFTLIELLVVVAVLALLISLLLPAIGSVRQTARQVVCASNLRQVTLAINTYGNEYKDWIVGSPEGSGSAVAESPARFNGIAIQLYDFIGPLAHHMGMEGPGEGQSNPTDMDRAARYDWYRNIGMFTCPSNNITAAPWRESSPPPYWTTGRMNSYNMSTQFTTSTKPFPLGTGFWQNQNRSRYTPLLSKLGISTSMKAAAFDGHRYAFWNEAPDYDWRLEAPDGGAFQGVGPAWAQSKELNRMLAPGEAGNALGGIPGLTVFDARTWAFRHGTKRDGTITRTQVYGNVAFFDGHVTLMSDGEATNPDMWFPGGTILKNQANWFNRYARDKWPQKCGIGGDYEVP